MVKIIYKYINEFINEEELIKDLENFYNDLSDEHDKKSVENLINDIKDIVSNFDNEFLFMKYDKVYNMILNNDVYLKLIDEMSDNDLMLMITDYILAPKVPKLNQEEFNRVVDAAINSGEESRENCFRLVTNYEYHNLKFDKIIDYFLSIRDVWYIVELMHFLQDDYDLDSIVNKIIETGDKEFIKKIINDEFINRTLDGYQIERLKECL